MKHIFSIYKNSKILFYNSKKFNLHNVLFHYFTHSFDLFATQKGENRVKKIKQILFTKMIGKL